MALWGEEEECEEEDEREEEEKCWVREEERESSGREKVEGNNANVEVLHVGGTKV